MLEFCNVTYSYEQPSKGRAVPILQDLTFRFEPSRLYAVTGPSGSGKSTFLALAAGLDAPTEGSVRFATTDLQVLGYRWYRNRHVGIVFQSLNLIPYLNALDNVVVAMDIKGVEGIRRERALAALERVGIDEALARRSVGTLSGGQQQRVAIARALACEVDLLLCDEPTGSLDQETAAQIIGILKEIAGRDNKCVIAVTHSGRVEKAADVVLRLTGGTLAARSKEA